jgi:omega-amidase
VNVECETVLKIVALQFDILWEQKARNFQAVEALLARAQPGPDSLVVLPEMFATGFSMNTGAIAETNGGQTEQFLAALAIKHKVFVAGGAAVQAADGGVRNKALVFSPAGKLLAYYAKMRPFSPGGEAEHYVAGERTTVFRWATCTVAPLICYDLRFPELFRLTAAAHRPELFLVMANWPAKRISHWVRLLQARAIENQAYVAGVNRIGADPFYEYSGRSLIIDPQGEIIADAGETQTWIEATPDFDGLQKYRQGLPFLADMRPIGY